MKVMKKQAGGSSIQQQRKARIRRKQFSRAGIQLFFFLTMPGAFAAGFSGAKYVFQWIGAGEPLQLTNFTRALLVLLALTILFGRYFCGYVCAFGAFGDFVHWLSALVQKKLLGSRQPFRLPMPVLRWGQKLKYVVLAAILVYCAMTQTTGQTGVSPWDVFSQLTALRLPGGGYLVGILLLVLIIVGMAVQERFFCQFLCPFGALFSLLPVLPFFSLHRDSANCIRGCNACERQCPVALKLEQDGFRNSECIACERCTAVCPKGNISRPEHRILPELVPVFVKAILFFALGCWLGLSRF